MGVTASSRPFRSLHGTKIARLTLLSILQTRFRPLFPARTYNLFFPQGQIDLSIRVSLQRYKKREQTILFMGIVSIVTNDNCSKCRSASDSGPERKRNNVPVSCHFATLSIACLQTPPTALLFLLIFMQVKNWHSSCLRQNKLFAARKYISCLSSICVIAPAHGKPLMAL